MKDTTRRRRRDVRSSSSSCGCGLYILNISTPEGWSRFGGKRCWLRKSCKAARTGTRGTRSSLSRNFRSASRDCDLPGRCPGGGPAARVCVRRQPHCRRSAGRPDRGHERPVAVRVVAPEAKTRAARPGAARWLPVDQDSCAASAVLHRRQRSPRVGARAVTSHGSGRWRHIRCRRYAASRGADRRR